MNKRITILSAVLFIAITAFPLIAAADKQEGELDIMPKEGVEGEWELRGPNDEVMAVIKSREKQSFKIYKPDSSYMGYVYESLNWVPKDARQKRELKIRIEDVKLFLDILQGEGTYEPPIVDFELKPNQNDKSQWDILDPDKTVVGRVEKSEQRFKFYDSDRLMGYLDTSGIWIPKLGINRREMHITPDQATFCLNVFRAIIDQLAD